MSNWTYYLVIVVIALAIWLLLVSLIVRGWRNRGRRQADAVGEFPATPDDLGAPVRGPHTGLYVGSTLAPSWQNRIAVGDKGDRASAELTEYPNGLLITRHGASEIWIPRESLIAVRTENGLAGKVMSRDGVLVIRWTLPTGVEIDSGLRGDDKTTYPEWVEAYAELNERAFAAAEEHDLQNAENESGTATKKED
ncbi:PH-like domain-containing protein [Gordonia sp. (in: high G+C Gram-positive bacteria)]|uniref:PH-like domain-containing protein n=1 Tax=Gordonia sp. (in: high G+C Gram-positive bacteria) TaxID=84139 RepID=UPI003F9C6006